MLDLLFIPVAMLYFSAVGMLFVYGINFFYLTILSARQHPPLPAPPQPEQWPLVTVQLPIFNELYVAERLIRAAANLDYPLSRLEIQVLDDSTDETTALVSRMVAKLRAKGFDIRLLHRDNRAGFKAGALAAGFQQAKGEFLAIFDADFIPPPDFLKRTVPHFHDPQIGFVQARWGHVNRNYSLLTVLQSFSIDAHFMVEQLARSRAGYVFNFNGTAGIWRRSTIESAGGWKADTLTEDLDLSYRAFLAGWRAVFLPDLEAPAELPVSFSAYRRQQHRWARGSLECALKLLPRVWRGRLSLPAKIEASLHLTGYGVHLLLFVLNLLYPVGLLLSQRYPHLLSLFGVAAVLNVTALAPAVFFLAAQKRLGRRKWWRNLPIIFFITTLGTGMMLNTVRAALQIVLGKRNIFERTPKFGISNRKEDWLAKRYQLRLDPLVYYEIALGFFNLFTIALAAALHNWVITVYASMFAVGLFFTAGISIIQAVALQRRRQRYPQPVMTK